MFICWVNVWYRVHSRSQFFFCILCGVSIGTNCERKHLKQRKKNNLYVPVPPPIQSIYLSHCKATRQPPWHSETIDWKGAWEKSVKPNVLFPVWDRILLIPNRSYEQPSTKIVRHRNYLVTLILTAILCSKAIVDQTEFSCSLVANGYKPLSSCSPLSALYSKVEMIIHW